MSDESMVERRIDLGRGFVTVIDEADWPLVRAYPWRPFRNRNRWYAMARKRLQTTVIWHVQLHRLILQAPSGVAVDHIDGDGLNNRRSNLRLATVSQNGANRGKQSNNSSGFKGVWWSKQKECWVASARLNGRQRHIGLFERAEDAARAYDAAAIELWGPFAQINFPVASVAADERKE